MTSLAEKGGSFEGIKLLLFENPLPPLEEAVAAAQAEVPHSNYYTEPHSGPLRQLISEIIGVLKVTIPKTEEAEKKEESNLLMV